jgi:hypothetical protein
MGKVTYMSEAARRSLEELEASILLAPDFPRRVAYTHTEYLELLKARSTEMYAPGLAAIERARDQVNHLQSLVDLLGRERCKPGVPVLARLWKDCALQPVWPQDMRSSRSQRRRRWLSSCRLSRIMTGSGGTWPSRRPLPADQARRSTILMSASGSPTAGTGY